MKARVLYDGYCALCRKSVGMLRKLDWLHKLRDAHLPSIAGPVLCINGTRDPFSDRTLMEKVLSQVGRNWTMHWLEGADHSFHVLKSSGRSDRDVLVGVGDTIQQWLTTEVK